MEMVKVFLLVAATALSGSSVKRMTLRLEISPGHFVTCPSRDKVVLDRSIVGVHERSLVIDGCPDYAECDTGSERELEIASRSLPDLRGIIAPEQRLALRMDLRRGGGCVWEVAVTSRGTPPHLVFFAADGVTRSQTAPLTVERGLRKAMRVRIGKIEVRVSAGQT